MEVCDGRLGRKLEGFLDNGRDTVGRVLKVGLGLFGGNGEKVDLALVGLRGFFAGAWSIWFVKRGRCIG